MASRPGEDGVLSLSPAALRVAGWVAVIALMAAIALTVRFLGGNADGTAVVPSPGASSSGGPLPIAFGTALDPATGQVTAESRTDRYLLGDTFAYSVPDLPPPAVVYVVVERTTGGPAEVVQAATDGRQDVPPDRGAIAFTVPAERLIGTFGSGTYRMRILLEPDADPIAEGTFQLVAEVAPAPSPSG